MSRCGVVFSVAGLVPAADEVVVLDVTRVRAAVRRLAGTAELFGYAGVARRAWTFVGLLANGTVDSGRVVELLRDWLRLAAPDGEFVFESEDLVLDPSTGRFMRPAEVPPDDGEDEA